MIFLIIYLLGCIATAVQLYRALDEGEKVTVGELITAISICTFSWISFFALLVVMFSDKVVFTKK